MSDPLVIIPKLLEGLSFDEMRELGLEALRDWRLACTGQPRFAMNALGRHLAPVLARKRGHELMTGVNYAEIFNTDFDKPVMAPVAEFVWWLIGRGYVYPHLIMDPQHGTPSQLILTRAGEHLLANLDDHPLSSGFVRRLAERCPGLPDGVIQLVQDAKACVEHGLLRPGVVLLGLAYELAVEGVANALATKGLVDPQKLAKLRQAWERSDLIKQSLPAIVTRKDERPRFERAMDFADLIRERRNDGAHTKPRYPFDDAGEVEELIVSACRHLPMMWSLTTL